MGGALQSSSGFGSAPYPHDIRRSPKDLQELESGPQAGSRLADYRDTKAIAGVALRSDCGWFEPSFSTPRTKLTSFALLGLCLAAPQHCTNSGGGPSNDGFSQTFGPLGPDVGWSAGPASIIGWEPTAANGRVFSVRRTGFPPAAEPNGSPIVAQDLETGQVLWTASLPFAAGDWTTWVGGTSNGALYAARSGDGATSEAPLVALEQDTGAVRWTSAEEIRASGYNGLVCAPDGDPIVAWNTTVRRIDADTGATVWSTPRSCSVTGACGGALLLGGPEGDKLYLVQVVPGGQTVSRFDLDTGAFELSGPTMPGFTLQNPRLVAPDGSIAVAPTQNNPATDCLYVFDDAGVVVRERWNVPTGWTTTSEFAVGRNGSIYAFSTDARLTRFDGGTGAVLDQSAILPTSCCATRLASDLDGRVVLPDRIQPDEPPLRVRRRPGSALVRLGAERQRRGPRARSDRALGERVLDRCAQGRAARLPHAETVRRRGLRVRPGQRRGAGAGPVR